MSARTSHTLQIYACGDHHHTVDEALPDLKAVTQQATGKPYRRIGRFIQLALIGAARCTQAQALPSDTAVYFASARGDLETTVEIMTQLFREGQTPKPLGFVNTVSNAACFYVAQLLGLQSRSNYVCNRYFAFENALQLAMLDLQCGTVTSALVASIDVATAPLHEHRQRLRMAANTLLAEGSHCVWLGPVDAQRPRLGELKTAQHFDNRTALLEWIAQQQLASTHCLLSAGQFIAANDFATIQQSSKLAQLFEYREQRGHYDSHSGAVIGEFLRATTTQQQLLHINADSDGRYSVMLLMR
jgi:hypothetical protein